MRTDTHTLEFRSQSGPSTLEKQKRQATAVAVGIVGSGSSASALAAHLSNLGHPVSMLTRDVENRPFLNENRTITASGKLEGEFAINEFTTCVESFLEQSEYIFVATVATAYEEVCRRLAPHLKAYHKIILFSSKLGGCLEVRAELRKLGRPEIPILETDALFACRLQKDESIWIKGIKRWTLYSSTSRSETLKHGDVIKDLFPGLEPAANVIQRGLTDFGALAHAPIMLANMNSVDKGNRFQFYRQGMTERTVKIMEQLESEFRELSQAFGADLIPMPELLNRYYGCSTESLLKAMCTVPNYEYSISPDELDHRFLTEDVSCTLVPASELAAKAGVDVPVMNSVITLASVLAGQDLKANGRNLKRLGIAQLDADSIRAQLCS